MIGYSWVAVDFQCKPVCSPFVRLKAFDLCKRQYKGPTGEGKSAVWHPKVSMNVFLPEELMLDAANFIIHKWQ
jgi:hypothetical protein